MFWFGILPSSRYVERGKKTTNNGAFAAPDRRAWEIVEFPVDGESRGQRWVEISKSELHVGKHPTECVSIHRGVSGEIHRKLSQTRADAGVPPVDRFDSHDALLRPKDGLLKCSCEWRVWSEQSGRSRPGGGVREGRLPECLPNGHIAGMYPRRSVGRHPCLPPRQGRHCEARLQANNLIARTESEEALELTTELRRTFISHLDARCGCRLLVSQHQQARLMKAY